VAQASDGREALEAIGERRPDVAVIERSLATLTGEQILGAVRRDGLGTRVIMLAAEPTSGVVYAAIAGGAAGYLTTDTDSRQLCEAISAVARGRTVLAPELQAGIAGEIRLREVNFRPVLSERERETLKLVAEGLTNRQIALQLNISIKTVQSHRANLMDKLDLHDRTELVRYAIRRGLIAP
jgi:two-component system nitrate/nitrite response regulator NarL